MAACVSRARLYPAAITAVLALGHVGCGSSAKTSVTGPTSVRCQASVTNSAQSFGPSGGTGTIAIGVARECNWSATTSAPWISITSVKEGQGDGTVTYRVAENADPVARQAAISVSDQQVSLAQQAAEWRYEVRAGNDSVGPGGGRLDVSVRAHPACAWTASSDVAYAAVSPAAGRGDALVQVMVSPNVAPVPRVVAITIAGERVSTTQAAGASAPAPTPSPAPSPAPAPAPTPAPAPAPNPPAPTPVREIELDGEVGAVSGSCPTLTFNVEGRTVFTTSDTEFNKGKCKDLKRGDDVEVRGWLMSDGRVRADRVRLDD